MRQLWTWPFVGAVVSLVACAEQEPDHRGDVLIGVVAGQVFVDLVEAHERGEMLHTSVAELCTSPDASRLDAAQDAWMQLRAPWKRLLALPLGPTVDDGFDTAIDFWPARPTSIDGGIATGITSQAELDALGVASKGMPAIEYLLWDPVGGDAAVLAALSGAEGPARCAYVELLAADVALRLDELAHLWLDGFGAQLQLTVAGDMYPTLATAIDALVNAMIAGLHDVDDMKLGKPLGLTSGAGPDPELVESRFSDRSLADARDALTGFETAYLGADADHVGLTVLVTQKSPAIDTEVRTAIATAKQALAAVPEPLRESLISDGDAVADAQAAVKQLRILMTADVASLLGVTVSLSDNDGD
jgi:predicted lipoprotein